MNKQAFLQETYDSAFNDELEKISSKLGWAGRGAVTGSVVGAVTGAASSKKGNRLKGALAGAGVGAVVGAGGGIVAGKMAYNKTRSDMLKDLKKFKRTTDQQKKDIKKDLWDSYDKEYQNLSKIHGQKEVDRVVKDKKHGSLYDRISNVIEYKGDIVKNRINIRRSGLTDSSSKRESMKVKPYESLGLLSLKKRFRKDRYEYLAKKTSPLEVTHREEPGRMLKKEYEGAKYLADN